MTVKYGIYYTDYTGLRSLYMNIGFASKEAAKKELDVILRQKKGVKLPYIRVKEIEAAGLHVSSVLTGRNWRIKKINQL
jgi:hypothetical protein